MAMVGKQQGFGWLDKPTGSSAEERPPRAAVLAGRLGKLAEQRIYLGTSSWKYPGWCGQIYDPARYQYRGKFAQKQFERRSLSEYATVFPTVCGDFVFYQFPSAESWQRNFEQVPPGYKFALKVPEEVTVERYPNLPRYGRRAGTSNGHFMDADLLRENLLAPLEPYRDKLGPMIFQFGTIHDGPMAEPANFTAALGEMLGELPTEQFAFAVEVRNPPFIEHQSYFATLRKHNTAHCLTSWTRMPPIDEQLRMPGVFTADHVVARLLLRPGRTYAQAVEKFAPYERMQDEYPEGRSALSELIERCQSGGQALFAYVNNRFEGNAVETIEAAI